MGAPINTAYTDSLPFLSSNEHTLYFYSTRPGCGSGDIWMTQRQNKHADWEEPVNLGCTLNGVNTSADDNAPVFFEDPQTEQPWLYYGSNRPGSADYDVYKAPLGAHGLPLRGIPGVLVSAFSSPVRDTRIFIRKDGLEAFITSNRTGGVGQLDIWTSTRESPFDAWSVPTTLGVPVDSTSNDGSPWLSKDGTTLYFFSDRPGSLGTAPLKRDIWYTTRAKFSD
jgi:hypothetical protein